MLEDGETLVVWSGPRSDGGRDTAGVKHLVWSGRAMWNSEPAHPPSAEVFLHYRQVHTPCHHCNAEIVQTETPPRSKSMR